MLGLHLLLVMTLTLALVETVRIFHEMGVAREKKKIQEGHMCYRLYAKNLITASERKQLNRAWYIIQLSHKSGHAAPLLDLYERHFYEVPDEDIDFSGAAVEIKALVKKLRENDYDALVDYMTILKRHVHNKQAFLNTKQRLWCWNQFWKKVDGAEIPPSS